MKAKRAEIVDRIHAVWPNLVDALPKPSNLAIPDVEYWLPKKSDIEWVLSDTWIDKYQWTAEGMDCDDIALLFHAFVVQERYRAIHDGKTGWLPWALGQCWGYKFQGEDGGHAINIAITRDAGVILIEPQNDKTWNADPVMDLVDFIRL